MASIVLTARRRDLRQGAGAALVASFLQRLSISEVLPKRYKKNDRAASFLGVGCFFHCALWIRWPQAVACLILDARTPFTAAAFTRELTAEAV